MKKQYYPLLGIIAIALFCLCIPPHSVAQEIRFKSLKAHQQGPGCVNPPIIQCPSDYIACPGASTDPSVSQYAEAFPGGPNCDQPIVSFIDRLVDTGQCAGAKVIQRLWTAKDPADEFLRAFCVQYLNTLDTSSPVFMNCPKDTSILTNSHCMSYFSWTMPMISDACGNFTVVCSHINGGEFAIGNHTIVMTATDACGNTSSCSFNLEVISNCCVNPPKITCPPDYFECPGSSLDPAVTGLPIIEKSSPACKTPLFTYNDRYIESSNCKTVIERTWLAVDPDNPVLHSFCSQIITIQDVTVPEFTSCPANTTVQSESDCTATVNWSSPLATDNCGQVIVSTSVPSGSKFNLGFNTVTATATDACGNTSQCEFTIFVENNCCKNAPVITCPADYFTCPGSPIDPTIAGTATALAGNPSCQAPVLSFKDDIIHNTDCETEIRRTWTAADPGNPNLISSCTQTIILIDTIPPHFTFVPTSLTVSSDDDCTAIVTWPPITAEDNCGHVNLWVSIPSGFQFHLGHTAVVAIATDACGNSTKCEFVVTVEENCCKQPPVLNCPPDFKDCPSADLQPTTTGFATAGPGEAHCNQPELSYTDKTLKYINCLIEVERTWTASVPGKPNLSTSCVQNILLVDQEAPVFTFCPPNVTVQSDSQCEASVSWPDPVAEDNCGTVTITTSLPSGYRFNLGTAAVVVIATDRCGNTSKCEFLVTVEDNCCNKPPVIHCPENYNACPGSSLDIGVTGSAFADVPQGNCPSAFITYVDLIESADPCRNITKRFWKAINTVNNSESSCIQTLVLEDTEAPSFSRCPPDVTIDPQYNCTTNIAWDLPIATDQCGIDYMLSTHQPNSSFSKGISTVVYTVTDKCGNTASCWFFINITDKCCDKNPELVCPPDYSSCPSGGSDPAVTGTATAQAGGPDCLQPVISYTDRIVSTGPMPSDRLIERTWVATDPNISSLRTQCIQMIELKDTEPPQIQNMPKNITVHAKGQCDVSVNWNHPIAFDNCALNAISCNYQPGNRFSDGITYVVYTAVDFSGLKTKDSFKITVQGTEVGISCTPDTTVSRLNPFINGAIVEWNTPKVQHCKPCIKNIPGFVYMGELDGHNYFCSTSPANWITAKQICEQLGGHLAVINSDKENKFLALRLNGQTAWIGATDEKKEGEFKWIDNSPFAFTNWMPGQPNNAGGNENYVEMLPDGSWNDQNGFANREFICEIKCYELTQIGGAPKGELLPCGDNTIKYMAQKDGKYDSCSFKIFVDCEKESIYCNAKGLNSKLMFIDRVEFAGIDSTTGDNGGFKYFNQACGKINPGQNYPICVTPGYLSTKYKVYWKIWIDFNADGFYDPVTEEVVYGYGNTTMCANLTMPAFLPAKQTRMRIIMSYSGYPASPCSSPLYGEVEDYCILMNGANPSLHDDPSSAIQFNPVKLQCAKHCEENEKRLTDTDDFIDLEFLQIPSLRFDVDLFPNPSSTKITVMSKTDDILDFEIYNTFGKMVYRNADNHPAKEFSVPVKEWPNGIYNIIIYNIHGEQITKRFMVNH
jgi:hypothetical protein